LEKINQNKKIKPVQKLKLVPKRIEPEKKIELQHVRASIF